MKPRLKSTRAARDLIKAHEPFLGEAQRRGRRWLVGYGHSAAAKEGVTLSRENADLLLIYDVLQAEQAVEAAAGADLPAPMRDALVSFAASVGANAFKVSDVARLTRAGKHREAAAALETWVRAEEGGRLVVSERLVRRRAAEKALYLTALDGPAQTPELAPEPAPQAQAEPTPRLGPLVEVDIAFEDWPAGTASLDAAAPEAEPLSEPAPEAPAEPEPAAEAQSEPEAEPQPEPELEAEPAPEAEVAAQATRTEQDGAVQAVLARMAASMAGDAARNAAPAARSEPHAETGTDIPAQPQPVLVSEPHPEPAREPITAAPPSNPVLGFSFLTPAVVTAPLVRPQPAPGPVHQPAPEPVAVGSSEAAPAGRVDLAPPHPGEAPARAAGLSGEVDGPERPEGEAAEAAHEDDAILDPAHVAGPEAMAHLSSDAAETQPQGGGVKIFIANLGLGLLMTGLGGWLLASNFEAYLADGIGTNDWPAPALFLGGVLLAVASGVTLAGRLKERSARRA